VCVWTVDDFCYRSSLPTSFIIIFLVDLNVRNVREGDAHGRAVQSVVGPAQIDGIPAVLEIELVDGAVEGLA